jgi:hypothetical protein
LLKGGSKSFASRASDSELASFVRLKCPPSSPLERRESKAWHPLKITPFNDPEEGCAELIERMAAGEEAALAAFYQRFSPVLYGPRVKNDQRRAGG